MEEQKRNYGIDLLKIVLAIMVITIHINAGGTGKVLLNSHVFPWKLIVTVITVLCYPAVNTYILITGYYTFQANKNFISIMKSLSLLWLSVIFFSLTGYGITIVLTDTSFDIWKLIMHLFPIIRGVWWFYTVYFTLMMLSPFINRMINCLSYKDLKLLLLILIFSICIFPVFVNWNDKIGSNYGYSLIWFITLYITGACLKITNVIRFEKNFIRISKCGYLLSSGIMVVWPQFFKLLGVNSTVEMYNSIFCYMQAIFLFVYFGNLKIQNKVSKIICTISNVSLSSYLFHCQEDFEKILWNKMNPSSHANDISILWVSLFLILFIFITGCLMEFVRKKFCKKFKIDIYVINLVNKITLHLESFL